MDREKFEKQLQVVNQRKVADHNKEEYKSFSNRNGQNHSNPRKEDNSRTGRHMANSTELPGHDLAATMTMMTKVKHCMSVIPHENEEEIRQRHDDDKVSMNRAMFTSLMAKALEDHTNLANATNGEAVKVAFTEGVKHGSERETQPIHSSPMEMASVHSYQNPIATSGEYGLNAVHLLRPETGSTTGTLMVNNAIAI